MFIYKTTDKTDKKLIIREKIFMKQNHMITNSLKPHGLYTPWNSLGQNAGVGNLSILQEVFLTQGSNPGLPVCRWILYQLSYKGHPNENLL